MIFKYSPRSLDPTGNRKIPLGKQGENKRMTLVFDVREWMDEYPEAELAVYVKPPEGEAYLAGIDKEQKGVYRWDITASDTAKAGEGMIELVMRDEATGTVHKSITAKTMILPSISADAPGEIPEAHVPWWERALKLIEIGVSPEVVVTEIEGGHRVEITDEKGLHTFDVMDGETGPAGADGKDYVLTAADKEEIAGMVEVPESGAKNLVDGENGSIRMPEAKFINRPYKSAAMNIATVDSANQAFAANFGTASGDYSFAENVGRASGMFSHAENNATASGYYSHAEGLGRATGEAAHAEGSGVADGEDAHAEGYGHAIGKRSHSEGTGTFADDENQHVQGRYNVRNGSEKYAHIVGNGNDSLTRSNAHTLDWDGNGWFAGDVYVGGKSQDEGEKLVKESAIPTVVNDALAQAKASGEFNGAPGAPGADGAPGSDGAPGEDGYSPTVTLTRTADGVRIDVQNKNGTQSEMVHDGKNAENNALLEGGTPNQMLVTDADGKVMWEKRTHWAEKTENLVEILAPVALQIMDDVMVLLNPLSEEVVAGHEYIVSYNGTEYPCTGMSVTVGDETRVILGNVGPLIGDMSLVTEHPFVFIPASPEEDVELGFYGMLMALDGATSVTLGIKAYEVIYHKLDLNYLPMDAIAEAVIAKIPSATGVSF